MSKLPDVSSVTKVTGKDLAKTSKEVEREIRTFAKRAAICDEGVKRLVIREEHNLAEPANLPSVDAPKAKPIRCGNHGRGLHRLNVKRLANRLTGGKQEHAFWLTSEMSHAGSWRAACGVTIWILWFHFETTSIARGVTAMVVGSGALLGRLDSGSKCDMSDRWSIGN